MTSNSKQDNKSLQRERENLVMLGAFFGSPPSSGSEPPCLYLDTYAVQQMDPGLLWSRAKTTAKTIAFSL